MKKGWEQTKLGDVCEVVAGQSPEGKYYNKKRNGLPFYQGKKEFREKYLGDPTTWSSETTRVALKGDVLMSVRAPVGPVNFSTQKICIGRGLAAIRAGNRIDKEFLYNFLVKHEHEIIGSAGAVFNSINKTQIEDIEIPLPPLPEQHRIVSILDEAFAVIAKAKANAEKNLLNPKELFESYLQSVFLNPMKDWEEKPLQDSVDSRCTLSYGIVQPGDEYPNGLPIVRPTDLTSKFVSLEGLKLINPQLATSYKRTTLIGKELLLCVRGSTGTVSISTEELKGANVTRGIVPIWFNPKFLSLEFGYYMFSSPLIQRQIRDKTYGTALMQINWGSKKTLDNYSTNPQATGDRSKI